MHERINISTSILSYPSPSIAPMRRAVKVCSWNWNEFLSLQLWIVCICICSVFDYLTWVIARIESHFVNPRICLTRTWIDLVYLSCQGCAILQNNPWLTVLAKDLWLAQNRSPSLSVNLCLRLKWKPPISYTIKSPSFLCFLIIHSNSRFQEEQKKGQS